jgi:hypothetical protein
MTAKKMDVDFWNAVFQWGSVGLVAVTFVFGAGALWTSNKINERQTERIRSLEGDTAKQQERAANAERDAAEAKAIAAAAGEGTLKALADVAAANERTAKLEIEAATARERAAKAETALLEVQEKMKPRTLSADVRAKLIASLQSADAKGEVLVACSTGDAEGCFFAREIQTCLSDAGWPVLKDLGSVPALTGYGIMLRVKDAASPPRHALALQRSLEAAGLQTIGVTVPEMPVGRVFLWVASKNK